MPRELQTGMTMLEARSWQTGAEIVEVRTMEEPEGRRSPVEPEGWRVEAQLLTRKSEAESERRSKVEPERQESSAESEG